ncbi:DNA/RNA nuclease SfsA [Evansella sp. LMS18]|uniref:DNA/RNA nuclease SfsA n=1 Tax=Evansella sp. LMS18 TaxID=2924033 RepID=UPI0020D0D767|nr:DNA/RNA nuclease SfsA [Evansella sp. LMS18]UTR09117.1 DNA/RNA nuclease SfsA [Evansella sp. LMS18]
MSTFTSFPESLIKSTFIERPNRFIVKCRIEESNELAEAHLPDPGRLLELLIPGTVIYLSKSNNPKRKTKYSAVIIEREDGSGFVSVNTIMPNKLAELAVKHRAVDSLKDWNYIRSEFTKGNSRWDMLLSSADGRQMAVEVKGVSLAAEEKGFFPDAVTKRGAKHVRELAEITLEENWESALIFVTQRSDITSVSPAEHIDPEFAAALAAAEKAGVHLLGLRSEVTLQGMEIVEEIPVYSKSSR